MIAFKLIVKHHTIASVTETSSKNGIKTVSKMVNHFSSQSSKFCIVWIQRRKRNIFQKGRSHFSRHKMLFSSSRNFRFGRPKQISVVSKSNKKKRVLYPFCHFETFPLPIYIFHPIPLQFSFFFKQKFQRDTVPPCPSACYATVWIIRFCSHFTSTWSKYLSNNVQRD